MLLVRLGKQVLCPIAHIGCCYYRITKLLENLPTIYPRYKTDNCIFRKHPYFEKELNLHTILPTMNSPIFKIVQDLRVWEKIITELPFSSFFWYPDWYSALLKSEKNAIAGLLTLHIGDQWAYVPFLKKNYGPFYGVFSGPDGSYGGILTVNSFLNDKLLFFVKKKLLRFQTIHFTLIPHPLLPQSLQYARPHRVETTWIIKGPLDFEDYFKRILSNRRRRNYRKAEREGLKLVTATEEDIELFLKWYKNGEWVKVYPEPFWYKLYESKRTEVLTVKKRDKTIAAAWFLIGKGEVFYFMGLYNRGYTEVAPMGFILIEAVRRYIETKKFSILNLGSSLGISSIEEFKRSLGALPLSVNIFRYYNPFLRVFQG